MMSTFCHILTLISFKGHSMWNQATLPTWPSWILLKLCHVNVLITFYPNHDNKVYTGQFSDLGWIIFLDFWQLGNRDFSEFTDFLLLLHFWQALIFTIQNPDSQMVTVKTGWMRSVSKCFIGVQAKVSIVNRFSFLNGYTHLKKFQQNPWESAGNFHEISIISHGMTLKCYKKFEIKDILKTKHNGLLKFWKRVKSISILKKWFPPPPPHLK